MVWICRRSWAEIGGAMCEMREVKVGRALEVRSVPGYIVPQQSAQFLETQSQSAHERKKGLPKCCKLLMFPLTCSAHLCASSFPLISLANVSACFTAADAALNMLPLSLIHI